jgi:hypothetical protein
VPNPRKGSDSWLDCLAIWFGGRERCCRLGDPALDDRIASIDRLGSPDQAGDPITRRDHMLDDIAEDVRDLGDFLPSPNRLPDLNLQPNQPAALGAHDELLTRAEAIAVDDGLAL